MVFLRQSTNVATFNFDVRHKRPMIFDLHKTMRIHSPHPTHTCVQLFLTYTISVKRNNWKQIVATFAQRLNVCSEVLLI